MLHALERPTTQHSARHVSERGYSQVYRENEVNHCPGCGRTHWYVGRISAECGFCSTALPLQDASSRGSGSVHTSGNRPVFFQHAGR